MYEIKINILIPNDDIWAPGIKYFDTIATSQWYRSQLQWSIYLLTLFTRKDTVMVASVQGTPTDSVHLAITGLLHARYGSYWHNDGANMGDDGYSGTGCPLEGRTLGYPALL